MADPDALRVARPSYFAQESFEPGGRFVAKPGAQRFDSGWTSLATLKGLAAALSLGPEWGYERIAELAARCRDALNGVVTAPDQAGLVTFEPDGDAEQVAARLLEQDVVVRNLPGTPWVRASCGWWNDESDLERLARGVRGP